MNATAPMLDYAHEKAQLAIVRLARNMLATLSDKYGGETTLNELRVINQVILCHLGGRKCSVTALHEVTGIPMATVSRAVCNLRDDGWLLEEQDPEDGRKRVISLSPECIDRTSLDIQRGIGWIKNILSDDESQGVIKKACVR